MPTTMESEIDALRRMTTDELADRYEELHQQPTRTRHREYLIRKIAWRMQALVEGDLSERARKRAAELANDAEVRVMAPKTLICPPQNGEPVTTCRPLPNGEHNDPRLPAPGSAIVREYKGRTIRVVVLIRRYSRTLGGSKSSHGLVRFGAKASSCVPAPGRKPFHPARRLTHERE